MDSCSVSSKIEGKQLTLLLDMPLETSIDNGSHVIHCPALDLAGYGKTPELAAHSFAIVLEEYLKYTTENKTLFADLERLSR